LREPRYPLLRVVRILLLLFFNEEKREVLIKL
jgi:hypothetical protein